ncbi:MAG TPA: NAD(P)-binding domain-containing protein [Mycobacteriales bacterium]|nr:NAD(P)-binding domain-containing protein [Mycobacteriales bacterium]
MRIAVIGAGNVGGALAAAATRAGHHVVLSASDPANARQVAQRTGAGAAAGNAEAVQGADAVVLAVPHGAVAGVVTELGTALAGMIVVDATNPLNESYSDLTTTVESAAERLQERAPEARVVKALNTVFASRYANPSEGGQPLTALLAGDDADAKATVSQLVESLGFRPVDAGSLRMARSLEEMAFLNIRLNAANGWTWQSHFPLVGPTAA